MYLPVKWFQSVFNTSTFFDGIDTARFDVATINKHSLTLDLSQDCIVSMNQTHSDDVVTIESEGSAFQCRKVIQETDKITFCDSDYQNNTIIPNGFNVADDQQSIVVNADALITKSGLLTLSVKTADCLPIFFMSNDYVAVVHAGREGTLKEISSKVARTLQSLGTQKLDVWFGPCACVLCYQIDQETNTHFDMVKENYRQIASVFSDDQCDFINPQGHFYCSMCHNDMFFSYRSGDKDHRNIFYLKKNK